MKRTEKKVSQLLTEIKNHRDVHGVAAHVPNSLRQEAVRLLAEMDADSLASRLGVCVETLGRWQKKEKPPIKPEIKKQLFKELKIVPVEQNTVSVVLSNGVEIQGVPLFMVASLIKESA